MKARIHDFAILFGGQQRITLDLDGDFTEQYELLKDFPIDFDPKKYRDKRSRDANAYAWVLIDKITVALSKEKPIKKEDVYREAIRSIGGVSEIVCVQDSAVEKFCEGWRKTGIGWQTETMPSKIDGCTNVIVYYGSSAYDTAQMSCLIDILIEEAKELGIETMTPSELARLEGYERSLR